MRDFPLQTGLAIVTLGALLAAVVLALRYFGASGNAAFVYSRFCPCANSLCIPRWPS